MVDATSVGWKPPASVPKWPVAPESITSEWTLVMRSLEAHRNLAKVFAIVVVAGVVADVVAGMVADGCWCQNCSLVRRR